MNGISNLFKKNAQKHQIDIISPLYGARFSELSEIS